MVSFKEVAEGVESRHEERVGRRHHRRDRRHERQDARRVRWGDIVTDEELENGEAVLEDVEPDATEPDEDVATEPWGWADKPMPGQIRDQLRAYREFLEQWREEHHDEPDDEGPEEVPE
jgi:hypothetical protein